MTLVRWIYLALAAAGAVLPMLHFVRWFEANGWSLAGLIAAWNVNDATTGLVYDLTVAAVALTVFILADGAQRRDWRALLVVPAIYGIGVAFALPFYLFLRGRTRG